MAPCASDKAFQDVAFNEIADAVPVALWRIDASFEHEWANKHWFELTGGRLEEEIGFAWADKLHPDDRERVVEEFDRAFDAHEATTVEFRLRSGDGTYRWFRDSGTPFYRDGAFAGFVGSCVDITERKEAEMQAQMLQTELIKLARAGAMGALSAAIVHEVRQPLHAISAHIEGLERLISGRADLPTGLAEAVSSIRLAAERAQEIVTRCPGPGSNGTTERTCEDLATVLHGLDPLIRIQPAAAGATITWELTAGLLVSVSRVQIEQVLLDLVINALQAMKDSPARAICISAVRWGDTAVVSVADHRLGRLEVFGKNGFKESICSPEDRADMGLYVSPLIISAHEGRIWVDDNPSGGSIVRFTLPLVIKSE